MKRFVFALVGVLLGSSSPSQALVNGTLVGSNDPVAQTTVGIYLKTPQGAAICSGTIISNTQILSAGHCAVGADQIFIVFHTDIREGLKNVQRLRPVVSRQVDPSYILNGNTDKDHSDISVLTFSGGIPAGLGYHPAKLMTKALAATVVKDEARIILAGYGATDFYANGGAGVLRKIGTKIDKFYTSGRSVKVGTHAHGACHGDSGGPAIISSNGQDYVFAVTSRATSTSDGQCTGRAIYSLIY